MRVRFDQAEIAAAIGTGTLVEAKLKLYIEQNWGGWTTPGRRVEVYRLTSDWTEMGSTWNCPDDTNTSNSLPDCSVQWNGGNYIAQETDHTNYFNGTIGWNNFDVKSDVDLFLSGSATNFGWLIRKEDSSLSGDVDFSSLQSSDSSHRPYLLLTIEPPNTPPTCAATISPLPNQYGWNNSNVTVVCSCEDSDVCTTTGGGPISDDVTGMEVPCHASDTLGATCDYSVIVNVDQTPPSLEITKPREAAVIGMAEASIEGNVSDEISGLEAVTCNGLAATVTDETFSCSVPVADGPAQLQVTATDLAGNSTSTSISVTVDSSLCGNLQVTSVSPTTVAIGTPATITLSGQAMDVVSQVVVDGLDVPFTLQAGVVTFDVEFQADAAHQVLVYSTCSADPFYAGIVLSGSDGTQPSAFIIDGVSEGKGVVSPANPFADLGWSVGILPTNEMLSDSSAEFYVRWTLT